jgi:predicted ribosomally synthesized peptide with SipW-like signal peptide
MNRRTVVSIVARSVLMLCVVLAVAGVTMATWSDTVTSRANVYRAGVLDLRVLDVPNLAWVQGPVSATWSASNMYPGQELNHGSISFKDAGGVKGSALDIKVANDCSVAGMDEYIEITRMDYENSSSHDMLLDGLLWDVNANGLKDLDDLEQLGVVGLPTPGTSGILIMDFRFNEGAGNEFQGGKVTAEFTFTLLQ